MPARPRRGGKRSVRSSRGSAERTREGATTSIHRQLAAVAAFAALAISCGGGTQTTTATSAPNPTATPTPTPTYTIEIATDLPASASDATRGGPAENGARLAIDQANTALSASGTSPHVTLTFVPMDDVGAQGVHDPGVGARNLTAAVADARVAGVVGPMDDDVAQAEMPIADQAPLALVSPAVASTCLTQDSDVLGCAGATSLLASVRPTGKVTFFRIATTDLVEGTRAADQYEQAQRDRTVYVVDDAGAGARLASAFTAEWQKLGGTVRGHTSVAPTASYENVLTQIAALQPDLLFFAGLDTTGGIAIRRQMPTVPALARTSFAGGHGIVTTPFAQTIGPLGGGRVDATTVVRDATQGTLSAAAQSFQQQYQAAFGAAPTVYSAAAYDCANLLVQAVQAALAAGAKPPTSPADAAAAPAFRQAVIDALQKLTYAGLTGNHAFDQNGDTKAGAVSLYQLGPAPTGATWVLQSILPGP